MEGLWELFPIFLVEHSDQWAEDYKEIEILLRDLLAYCLIHRISHIGSTTTKGIWAKKIVDVLVEISESSRLKDMAQILEQNGFTIMSAEEARISLNKGYTQNGFADRVYHIILR